MTTTTPSLGLAFEMAFAAHQGQYDKAGVPYITHLVRVACGVDGQEAQTVALLHDIVEDTEMSLERLSATFTTRIVEAVDAITKRQGEAYDVYLRRVRANPLALEVKRADMTDNSDPERLARLDPAKRAQLEAKYTAARAILAENE